MKKLIIEVVTFQMKHLPDNSHGASFPEIERFFNEHKILPTKGMDIYAEGKVTDINSEIKPYDSPFEWAVITDVRIVPWKNTIEVIIEENVF